MPLARTDVAGLLEHVHDPRADPARLRQASRTCYDCLERLATHPGLLDGGQLAALREEIRRLL